jgi:tRNA(Arg) A34 adenosine deaminase TadA
MRQSVAKALIDQYSHIPLNPPHNSQVHFAAVISRNHVVAVARNTVSRSNRAGFFTKHAERAVLERLGNMNLLRGATLFVWRSTKASENMNSKPCKACSAMLNKCIEKWGLKNVVWTL